MSIQRMAIIFTFLAFCILVLAVYTNSVNHVEFQSDLDGLFNEVTIRGDVRYVGQYIDRVLEKAEREKGGNQ